MDAIDRSIIILLAKDARRSLADIGGEVGLSPSAVNERIRRLTSSGAIRSFTVDAEPTAMGLPVLAFVWLALRQDADEADFRSYTKEHPAVDECHHVTGAWSYLIKVRAAALEEIESFLSDFKARGFLGRSETIIALSSPVAGPYSPNRMRR